MKKSLFLLLLGLVAGVNVWGYRITDNYTIESKFKINTTAAGIAFAGYQGYNGNICMWQFSIGGGEKSVVRPHDWRVGGILLEEVSTVDKGITLNNTDWFVTQIVISNNGNHADTYLRADTDAEFVLVDSRDSRFDNEFRFGLVGTREDGESASFDYFKVTDAEGKVLFFDDFESSAVDWRGEFTCNDGVMSVTSTGGDKRSFPNNMFIDAVDLNYSVEADVLIESGYISFVFGLGEDGSNYMWQLSPNYYNDGTANIYYHLDNGNENWKAHAAGPRFPDFFADDFTEWHHLTISVEHNVVTTYIDGLPQDIFTQCDMTDLEKLNDGGIGLRADGSNGIHHKAYVDNIKVTKHGDDGVDNIVLEESFTGGASQWFDLSTISDPSLASVVNIDDNDVLLIDVDGSNMLRLLQVDEPIITTAISQMARMNDAQKVYNLLGQPVSQPASGIFIINGKKVVR